VLVPVLVEAGFLQLLLMPIPFPFLESYEISGRQMIFIYLPRYFHPSLNVFHQSNSHGVSLAVEFGLENLLSDTSLSLGHGGNYLDHLVDPASNVIQIGQLRTEDYFATVIVC
jgi:hypothetical protein